MNISIRYIDRADMADISRLANNIHIAQMTANLPYPYTPEHAQIWLSYIEKTPAEHVFAVTGKGVFMGVVGLVHEDEHERAELGYWLGEEFWNKGVMSKAAQMAVAYAFSMLKVNKVYSRCFAANTASHRVLEKCGFALEGCLKAHQMRMGRLHDLLCYGLLKQDYQP